jgi:hypothetical protein
MTDPANAYHVLLGLAGLLNPIALLFGAGLGWYADARAKLVIAGFGAAAFSLVIDAAMHLSGLSPLGGYDGGAMAVFPFRWLGAGLAAALVYAVRGLRRKGG